MLWNLSSAQRQLTGRPNPAKKSGTSRSVSPTRTVIVKRNTANVATMSLTGTSPQLVTLQMGTMVKRELQNPCTLSILMLSTVLD